MTTINYIWMGTGRLGPLELFNIYSWKLVGCDVGIYTLHWTTGRSHDAESLGLAQDAGVAVHDLHAILEADGSVVTEGDPRRLCSGMRDVLSTWYNHARTAGLDGDAETKRDQIFNMVDLTKSYIGATRRGIVLDLKVGPSPHLRDYAEAFKTKFISYTRGTLMVGGSGGLPENQCIGTMQESNTLRCSYASHFNGKVQLALAAFKSKPKDKHYDQFTIFHARFFGLTLYKKDTLNVTLKAPDGTAVSSKHTVKEIDREVSHGPFRVFKRSGDQTNQSSGVKTTPAEVKALARYVWFSEIPNYGGPGRGHYRDKVEDALFALPER